MPDSEEQRPKRNVDDRIDAIAMNLELLSHDVQQLTESTKRNAEDIRVLTISITKLTSIVETLAGAVIGHERRLTSLEGE